MALIEQINVIFKTESRVVLATLVRLLGDFDLAEEAMQEAFSVALERWPTAGIPKNPPAWLVSTARFKAIDSMRRRGRGEELTRELAAAPAQLEDAGASAGFQDDQLRLIFTCCHPALVVDARVALSLRTVCGLRTDEIARAFLVSSEAMKRRLTRAKAQLRNEEIPYEIPDQSQLPARLAGVLQVVYLVYNEGYSATSGDEHIRRELTTEAIFLSRLIAGLLPEPEALGLLALLLLHESRSTARVDPEGNIITLEDQDRSLWNQDLITDAQVILHRSIMSGRVGPYSLQAAIASVHAAAESVESTQWNLIVDYYDLLLGVQPGPVVELQRAIAVAMRDGPAAGLALVEPLVAGKLAAYHSAHAVLADLARRLGQTEVAQAAYIRAIEMVRQGPERRYLEGQLKKIS